MGNQQGVPAPVLGAQFSDIEQERIDRIQQVNPARDFMVVYLLYFSSVPERSFARCGSSLTRASLCRLGRPVDLFVDNVSS